MKASRRDLAPTLMAGLPGATTVAATMWAARQAGIRLFATGGIGGVHRSATTTFDVSADLTELGRAAVAVVCSGPKLVLDLALTMEWLETVGVPVVGVGWGCWSCLRSTARRDPEGAGGGDAGGMPSDGAAGGRVRVNHALLLSNARLAARIAVALAGGGRGGMRGS